jgi:peroxiredoxin
VNANIITPGEPAPDFELNDINGNPVRLSSFRGNKPVVLAFLRGFM